MEPCGLKVYSERDIAPLEQSCSNLIATEKFPTTLFAPFHPTF